MSGTSAKQVVVPDTFTCSLTAVQAALDVVPDAAIHVIPMADGVDERSRRHTPPAAAPSR